MEESVTQGQTGSGSACGDEGGARSGTEPGGEAGNGTEPGGGARSGAEPGGGARSGTEPGGEAGNGTEPGGEARDGAESRAEVRDSLSARIRQVFPSKKQDVRVYSPLALAYIGDAVYDLIIRTVVVERANRPARELHRLTVQYVSANAQSRIAQALAEEFTEEERAVFRRGRNAKPHTKAKNASMDDYMKATGFEAVLGSLYLTDNMERVLELVKKGVAVVEGKPDVAGIKKTGLE